MTTIEDYKQAYELASGIPQNTDFKKFARVVSVIPKGSTILDIGCAEGLFAVTLAERGHRITGIDISENFVQKARILAEKKKVNDRTDFFVMNIESQAVAGAFDWILFLDVIEHLENPIRALRNIRKSMTESSRLIVTTPNIFAWNRLMFHFFDKGGIPDFRDLAKSSAIHLQEYSLKTLARLLNFAGLEIVRLEHRSRYSGTLFVVCKKCVPISIDDYVKDVTSRIAPQA